MQLTNSQNNSLTIGHPTSVFIATGLYPPDIGGPATYSKTLAEELPKHGLKVSVFSFGEVRKLPKILRHIAYFFKVWHRGRKADIIYAQDPVSVGFPAVLSAKILRKKFLLKVVGDYAWEQFQQSKALLEQPTTNNQQLITIEDFQNGKFDLMTEIRRRVERWVAKRAFRIIVPSEYLKKIVLMWGVNEEKISVIPNGFKSEEYGNRETLRALLRFEGKLIISAGRLVSWKGFDALIEIFPKIKEKFTDAKLIIAGSGPDMKRLQNIIDDKGFSDCVSLTGALKKDVLLRYIKASDIFVLNSGYEGFSHQLLEVMDVGVPVVSTKIGGNPEIVENGKNGILVRYNDKQALLNAIVKILSDNSYGKSLADNAKRRVKVFTEDKMIRETLNILK
jgi:glycosyltransferase involved in cell wall biosynthesis